MIFFNSIYNMDILRYNVDLCYCIDILEDRLDNIRWVYE